MIIYKCIVSEYYYPTSCIIYVDMSFEKNIFSIENVVKLKGYENVFTGISMMTNICLCW